MMKMASFHLVIMTKDSHMQKFALKVCTVVFNAVTNI